MSENSILLKAPAVKSGFDVPNNRSRAIRIKIFILLILAIAHCLFTIFAVVPGHLSIDEALYSMMLKNFSKTFGLEIWTGYQELPSVELAHEFLRVHFGRPVSQYPYLYPVVALPFYAIAGFRGLFILNSLAFTGVVALCFGIARKLYRDLDLALNACLILVLATYVWEYSQSAWPHMTALLFLMTAFYLVACAYFGDADQKRLFFSAAAGLVAGFAPGVRVDAFLILPCLVLPFLFARPWRPWEALAIGLAAIPGLAALAATNYIKFGVMSPFSYGTGPSGHTPSVPLPFVAAAVAGLLALWSITRPVIWSRITTQKRLLITFLLIAIVAVLSIPQTRDLIQRIVVGVYMMLVDLRVLDPGITELSLARSPTGGLIYLGALKKSLLQSLPYLVVLVVPFLSPNRRKDFEPLAVLGLIPLTYLGFFGYARDHGGLCLNLRFFLPMLPFTSILAAYSIRDLQKRWNIQPSWTLWVIVSTLTAVLYLLLTQVLGVPLAVQELIVLVGPLLIAGSLLVLIIAGESERIGNQNGLRNAAWLLLIAALTWSAASAFLYDYQVHRAQRIRNHFFGEQVLRVIPADSVFFTFPYIDPFMRLVEKDRVRIVLPGQDQFQDFPQVLDSYVKGGKRIFGVFPPVVWLELKKGPLAGYKTRPMLEFPDAYLAEIVQSPPSQKISD